MPDEQILSAANARELETLEISLWAKAMRSSVTIEEYIRIRQMQGASIQAIRADLLTDLQTGGRIFGEFRRAVRATGNGTINRFRDNGQISEQGIDQTFKWAAVMSRTCPDCADRHGKEQTWEEWEAEGLPRTGQTVCKENCRCMLIPGEASVFKKINIGVDTDFLPIRRSARA